MHGARYWIDKYKLQKHPEGGWYREIYRSAETIQTGSGERNVSTSIYYLLEGADFSAFHRIRSDEIWHYYAGTSAIEIVWIDGRELKKFLLGNDENADFQAVVPKNSWFAARLVNTNGYAFVGCTVAPGFHFDDFELAGDKLLDDFSELEDQLKDLVRSS